MYVVTSDVSSDVPVSLSVSAMSIVHVIVILALRGRGG